MARVALARFFLALLLLSFFLPVAPAQDLGVQDSAYFLSPIFTLNACDSTVLSMLPLYLFSDDPSNFFSVTFELQDKGTFQGIVIPGIGSCDSVFETSGCDSTFSACGAIGFCFGGYYTPTQDIILQCIIESKVGDTVAIATFPNERFTIGDGSFFWHPSGGLLDTTFVVPMTFSVPAGDADASGTVSITDAVFIINYIFGAGCAPYDVNSADPDGSCNISVSDAVYIINFIFGGGSPPTEGCVLLISE